MPFITSSTEPQSGRLIRAVSASLRTIDMSFSAQSSSQFSARTSNAQLRALESRSASLQSFRVDPQRSGQRHAFLVSGKAGPQDQFVDDSTDLSGAVAEIIQLAKVLNAAAQASNASLLPPPSSRRSPSSGACQPRHIGISDRFADLRVRRWIS